MAVTTAHRHAPRSNLDVDPGSPSFPIVYNGTQSFFANETTGLIPITFNPLPFTLIPLADLSGHSFQIFAAASVTDVVSRPLTTIDGLPADGSFPTEAVEGSVDIECVGNGVARVLLSIAADDKYEETINFPLDRICFCDPSACGHGTCTSAVSKCACEPGWFGKTCDARVTVAPSPVCRGSSFAVAYDVADGSSSSLDRVLVLEPTRSDLAAPSTLDELDSAVAVGDLQVYASGYAANNFAASVLGDGSLPPASRSFNTTVYKPSLNASETFYVAYVDSTGSALSFAPLTLLASDDPSCISTACTPSSCNSGTCNTDTGACECPSGLFGDSCELGCASFTTVTNSSRISLSQYLNNFTCYWLFSPSSGAASGVKVTVQVDNTRATGESFNVYSGTAAIPGNLLTAASDDTTSYSTSSSLVLIEFISDATNPGSMNDFTAPARALDFTVVARGCPAGSYTQDIGQGTIACTLCSPGSFSTSTDEVECTLCAAGRYAPAAGSTTCLPCALGTSTNSSTGASQCDECEPGSFAEALGQAACELCEPGTFSSEAGASECSACPSNGYSASYGSTACSKCPANTVTRVAISLDNCECDEGFYTLSNSSGVACTACPSGAYCAGSSAYPVPAVGYWSSSASSLNFFECIDDDQCPGGSAATCAEGYRGAVCGYCDEGFYRVGHECIACSNSSSSSAVFALGMIAMFALAITMYSLTDSDKVEVSLMTGLGVGTTLRITIMYLQMVGTFYGITTAWSQPVFTILSSSNVANLDISFLRVECVAEVRYKASFYAKALIPLLVVASLLVMWVLSLLQRCLASTLHDTLRSWWPFEAALCDCHDAHEQAALKASVQMKALRMYQTLRASVNDIHLFASSRVLPNDDASDATPKHSARTVRSLHAERVALPWKSWMAMRIFAFFTEPIYLSPPRLVLAFIKFADIFYISIITNALQIFNCYDQPDSATAAYLLRADPTIECYSSEWMELLPGSILSVALFGIGLPAVYVYCLRVYTTERARGLSAQQVYESHPWIAWAKMIWLPYRDEYVGTELRNLLRKFALSAAVISFGKDPVSKILFTLVVLLLALYWYSAKQPYILREHTKFDAQVMLLGIAVLMCALICVNEDVVSSMQLFAQVVASAALFIAIALIVYELAHGARLLYTTTHSLRYCDEESYVLALRRHLSHRRSQAVLRLVHDRRASRAVTISGQQAAIAWSADGNDDAHDNGVEMGQP